MDHICIYCGKHLKYVKLNYNNIIKNMKNNILVIEGCDSDDHKFYNCFAKISDQYMSYVKNSKTVVLISKLYVSNNHNIIEIIYNDNFTKIDVVYKNLILDLAIDFNFEENENTLYIGEPLNICKEKILDIMYSVNLLS